MKTFWILFYFTILIFVVAVGVFFAVDNASFVPVNFSLRLHDLKFLDVKTTQPVWMIIFVSLVLGYLLATVIMSWKIIRLAVSRKKYINLYEKLKFMMEKNMNEYKEPEDDNK